MYFQATALVSIVTYVFNFCIAYLCMCLLQTEHRIKDGDQYIIGVGKSSVAIKKSLYSDYPDVLEFRVKLSVMRLTVRVGR